MSSIKVFGENEPERILEESIDHDRIAQLLSEVGVRFERWEANGEIRVNSCEEEIIAVYQDSVDRLIAEYGFQTVDVIHMQPGHPQKTAFRAKFLQEHTHSEDEVRFFVEGSGLFSMHIEDRIFSVLCEKGDLISVPAGVRHWFDMGTQPEFTAIRFFNNPEGWVANFTGSSIANAFPRMAFDPKIILVDIEGTIASISFVKDVLFPYARKNIPSFVASNRNNPAVQAILADVGAGNEAGAIAQLLTWIDQDEKKTPLKELQGMVWEDGYRNGHFSAHLYEDAHLRLKQWHDEGKALHVYSSGSVKAQELMFEHTVFGDIRSLFSGFYDTRIGQKKEAASYVKIAAQIGCEPGEILFLSDVVAELDAAREAGMSTALLARDADPGLVDHDCFTSLTAIPTV